MVIPRDAFDSKEEMEAYLAGRPFPKKVEPFRPEPTPPAVSNQIKSEDIPDEAISDNEARMKNHRNATGVIFTGRDVRVQFEGGKSFEGWLSEGDFEKLKERIPPDRIDLLKKISLI